MASFRSLPHLIRQDFLDIKKLGAYYLVKVLDVQRLSRDYSDLFSPPSSILLEALGLFLELYSEKTNGSTDKLQQRKFQFN